MSSASAWKTPPRLCPACPTVAPGRKRPMRCNHHEPALPSTGRQFERSRWSSGSVATGTKTTGWESTCIVPRKPAGATPTIVNGTVLMMRTLPSTPGSPPSRPCQ